LFITPDYLLFNVKLMNRITTKYKKRQGDISLTCQCVIEQMENNEDFPDPPAALAELKKVYPEFRQALANALSRDRYSMAVKDNLKEVVLGLLQELADYVTETCKGDRSKMLSSGFDVNSVNGNNKRPPAIEKLEVELGPSGEAITRVRHITNAIAFVHQFTTEPPSFHTRWFGEGSSQNSYTFRGLDSGKKHWFRVVAIGYYGKRGYSPVICKIIQ
jgi:hypothetical protein